MASKSGSAPFPKKRKLKLDSVQCQNLGSAPIPKKRKLQLDSVQCQNSGSAPFPKKRKLQLDSVQCQNLASQGSASLTNPTQAPNSSAKNTDPNKGAYESSPNSSSTYKPEKLSLAVEISNCQNEKDEVIEISSDDSDELDNVGFFGVKNSKTAEIDNNNPGSPSKPRINFNDLPIELKEMIFRQLPLTTLLSSAALVCKEWNEIISDEYFQRSQKWYHKIKRHPSSCGKNALEYIGMYVEEDLEIISPEELISGIIKDIGIFEKKNTRAERETNAQMIGYLKNHRKYPGALTLVKKEFPEVESDHDLNAYAIISAVVAISETFEDVSGILQLLTHSKSSCNPNDILRCFYYLACIYYYAALIHKVGKGIHYRLYYAIYHYENSWFGTQNDMPIAIQSNVGEQYIYEYGDEETRLTSQQTRIIKHELAPNQVIKIVGYAGTGKTWTLVEFTKKRPGLKFLKIVFDRSIYDQARTIFPPNVECRTSHSLAYDAINVENVHKYEILMKPKDLEKLNLKGPKHRKGQNPNAVELDRYRGAVLETLENFINSADETVTIKHAPSSYHEKNKEINFLKKDRLAVVNDATTIWKRMIDPNDLEVKMMRDGYLKLHQLQKPSYEGYDCILVDEAQDFNPTMLSIILNQKAPKIIAGDPNQKIYFFRGAVNALESIEHTHVYYLSRSFRFGPEIAYVANTILFEAKKRGRSQALVGGKQKAFINQKHIGQLAILARTEAGLFKEAVRMICLKSFNPIAPRNILPYFFGKIWLRKLADIYNLKMLEDQNKTLDEVVIKDEFIRTFRSFSALKAYAMAADDEELNGRIRLVEQYKENIPSYVENIVANCVRNIKTANVVFSCAQRAKGMEFDTVMLADDFSTLGYPYEKLPKFQQNQEDRGPENELNLLYMAVTRAKKCLLLNSALYYILLGSGERFEYPIFHTDVRSWVCCGCDVNLDRSRVKFVLTSRNLTLANGQEAIKEGSLCQQCVTIGRHQGLEIVHPDGVRLNFEIDIQNAPKVNRMLFSELIKLE